MNNIKMLILTISPPSITSSYTALNFSHFVKNK